MKLASSFGFNSVGNRPIAYEVINLKKDFQARFEFHYSLPPVKNRAKMRNDGMSHLWAERPLSILLHYTRDMTKGNWLFIFNACRLFGSFKDLTRIFCKDSKNARANF